MSPLIYALWIFSVWLAFFISVWYKVGMLYLYYVSYKHLLPPCFCLLLFSFVVYSSFYFNQSFYGSGDKKRWLNYYFPFKGERIWCLTCLDTWYTIIHFIFKVWMSWLMFISVNLKVCIKMVRGIWRILTWYHLIVRQRMNWQCIYWILDFTFISDPLAKALCTWVPCRLQHI